MNAEITTENGFVQRRVADSVRAKAQAFHKNANAEIAFIQRDSEDMATRLNMALEELVTGLTDEAVQKFEATRADRQRAFGKAREEERSSETVMREDIGKSEEE